MSVAQVRIPRPMLQCMYGKYGIHDTRIQTYGFLSTLGTLIIYHQIWVDLPPPKSKGCIYSQIIFLSSLAAGTLAAARRGKYSTAVLRRRPRSSVVREVTGSHTCRHV